MPNFKNVKPFPVPIAFRNPIQKEQARLPQKNKWIEARMNAGMITMFDPVDIPPSAVQLGKNVRFRFDRVSRRAGFRLFDIAKPNAFPVITLGFHKKNNNNTFFLRFTSTTIFYVAGGAWVPVAPIGLVLAGTDTDRFQVVTALDRLVFTNNGVDVIQEIDFTLNQYKPLGNAPQARFITGFANRIVAANIGGLTPNSAMVQWSGDGNLDEWDPLVDESAGFNPLVESPADLGDAITGIFGFTNVMIILREQSIWLATKQPIAQAPFNFFTIFPGVGCDAPDSVVVTVNGLTWLDRRTGMVWTFTPGESPQPIGTPISRDLLAAVTDVKQIFASYDSIRNEYTVCIPLTGSNIVRAWIYNFQTQAWAFDEYEGISFVDNIEFASAITTIDSLPGTIDQLTGTIDELSPTSEIITTRMLGRFDGEILIEDINAVTDPVFDTGNGIFETELISKSFTLPTDDVYISEVRIDYKPIIAGTLKLYHSKDGGETFNTNPKSFVVTSAQVGKAQILRFVKQIKVRQFAWRLTATDGQFEILGYEVHNYFAGESKR